VKVGKSECGFLKLTPLSRSAAMIGAVSAVTFKARRPSGMNRIMLCAAGVAGRVQEETASAQDKASATRRRCDMVMIPRLLVVAGILDIFRIDLKQVRSV